MPEHRVFITAAGSCTAAGNSQDLWKAVTGKKSALTAWPDMDCIDPPLAAAGRYPFPLDAIFPPRTTRFASRHSLLGAEALAECLTQAHIPAGPGTEPAQPSGLLESAMKQALIFGSASQGVERINAVLEALSSTPFSEIEPKLVNCISNAGACQLIATRFGIFGPNVSVEAASSSGLYALHQGAALIRTGSCNRVYTVAGEANLNPATCLFYSRRVRLPGQALNFFGTLPSAEPRPPEYAVQPFCTAGVSDRGAIAEGSAALLLETAESAASRKASLLAEVEHSAVAFFAENFNGSDQQMKGLASLLERFTGQKFDSIYLPVTGCYVLDAGLYSLCSRLFPHTHCFTAEPVIGHTGGATGLINAALAVRSLTEGLLLPTANLHPEFRDPCCTLKPADEIQPLRFGRILVVSSGWGGYSSVCILSAVSPDGT